MRYVIITAALTAVLTGWLEVQAAQEYFTCLLSLDPVCMFDSSFICSSEWVMSSVVYNRWQPKSGIPK